MQHIECVHLKLILLNNVTLINIISIFNSLDNNPVFLQYLFIYLFVIFKEAFHDHIY